MTEITWSVAIFVPQQKPVLRARPPLSDSRPPDYMYRSVSWFVLPEVHAYHVITPPLAYHPPTLLLTNPLSPYLASSEFLFDNLCV